MPKPPTSEPVSPTQTEPPAVPRWETVVMILSFVGLWVWFGARQIALGRGEPFSALWQIPLAASLGVLIWIFVRRTRRTLLGLKAIHPARRGPAERN